MCAAHRELLKYAARLLQERLQVIDCDLLLCGRHPRYLSIVSRLHRALVGLSSEAGADAVIGCFPAGVEASAMRGCCGSSAICFSCVLLRFTAATTEAAGGTANRRPSCASRVGLLERRPLCDPFDNDLIHVWLLN